MAQKLKFLHDVEIVEDRTGLEMQGGSGRVTYSYQACGGGGGCGCGGGCGICGGVRKYADKNMHASGKRLDP